MSISTFKNPYYLTLVILILSIFGLQAQEGDQILDGIGETDLIARYALEGDAKDWSRNNLHAEFSATNPHFVSDLLFEKVIEFSGKANEFISLPPQIFNGVESLSVSSWMYLKGENQGFYLFDFGQPKGNHFFAAPHNLEEAAGFVAGLETDSNPQLATGTGGIEPGKWAHLVVVLDFPAQSLRTYINGKEAAEEMIRFDLADAFTKAGNKLTIGQSLAGNAPAFTGKLHDFRIYRTPLTENQVKRIYNNALHETQVVNEREEENAGLPQFDKTIPQLYNAFLTGVEEVTVSTAVGELPRLPRYLKGSYRNGITNGPAVRVIWPAPTDNASVAEAGSYVVTGSVPGTDLKPQARVIVSENLSKKAPKQKLEAFALDQVYLNPATTGEATKLIENRDKFIETLAETNPDSFLYMFRDAFGQTQPEGAEPLGVWDSQETKLRGHATGHYLSALAQAYASTAYDPALQKVFKDKMDYMVAVLYELSQLSGKAENPGGPAVADPTAVPVGPGNTTYNSNLSAEGIRNDYWNWGKGFISAYPPDQFIMLEGGAKYGGQENQIWAPYYTLHKILAGLMDIYEVSENTKALEIATGMGDWVHARLSQLPTDTLISMWNTYIAGEFGGMNESMAHLYSLTNQDRYLETAKLFDNIKVFYGDANHTHGLAKNVDTFRGLHANQHIPQIVGALEMYSDTQAPEYLKVADNFWYKVKNDYMYSIGGVAGARNPANAECFVGQPATLYENGLSAGGQNETCGTYNMLKLTRGLFLVDPRTEFMDYYEQGLYNQILASVAEDSPANTYHIPLRPGSTKQFSNADMSGFTCCNGTALESSTKLQNSIYFKSKDDKALYVNLYVPSTLNWESKGISIEQETDFPREDETTLIIKGKAKFEIKLRVPEWATKGISVTINGKAEKIQATPGSYLSIKRNWKNDDRITIKMPFSFHLKALMDQPNIASLFYGPVLLAAQETSPLTEFRKIQLNAKDLGKTITGNPKTLEFKIDGIPFKPFYDTYGRHSVYLDVSLN
ncbi:MULTISPECIES: beta-L-arabinofuranosidase domain-containing protein [unclassified Leeuwenhoekiella]|uniref:beta-L-arabinofuranosidase domain-containing protein n=1 Tax=unclassified Leeuwenhoekiella TaxID=2615029 RepID=UPI000C358F9E|nr:MULTISPECIES: beta-L-arabinofuranosidase domain-containing protein [unclassified Leeuwenhoekiella]MAW94469.1 hypothetical protein [Leeuwenhoekiella sp.]MAW96965.1 hypothetical protein [Leeuwenhoekiella sp.]MBA81147.1 hypothetical protein [Leeuwenhoekiella sp.]|tara:strand:- start:26475 stop:29528 length:3054 start_codon:yes stop_codon:yes gene_type:complete